jgi:hypothetical protein
MEVYGSRVPVTFLLVKKVKFSRYRPRWPRGWVALPFLDRGIRRGRVVNSTPQPLFTPGKDPVPIVQEAGWAPGPVWTAENLAPPGFDPRTVQPVVSRYTDWATWPTIFSVCQVIYASKLYIHFLSPISKQHDFVTLRVLSDMSKSWNSLSHNILHYPHSATTAAPNMLLRNSFTKKII